ncbi:DUF5710 domain-containing protein [Undibacterium arcticum]
MNKAPPFDPPYITTTDTIDGARAVETLADGTERVVTAQAIIHGRAVSSRPATPARKAVNPVVHGNAESILFLDVPFAEKDSVKRLGARWDGAMRKWYIPPRRGCAPVQPLVARGVATTDAVVWSALNLRMPPAPG